MVKEKFKTFDLKDLIDKLDAMGLPYAPINKPQDLVTDPHLLASGGLLDIEIDDQTTAKLPALPIELSEKRLGVRHQIPKIGEHTNSVLQELGYSAEQIESLQQKKIAE